eukprot:1148208-Pelagomonas_calceolata.AAC.16
MQSRVSTHPRPGGGGSRVRSCGGGGQPFPNTTLEVLATCVAFPFPKKSLLQASMMQVKHDAGRASMHHPGLIWEHAAEPGARTHTAPAALAKYDHTPHEI